MSFDEIDHDENSHDQLDTLGLNCTVCGSTSFYRDHETDNVVCSQCYTQSQSQSQRETTDMEDVFAMVQRRGGRCLYRSSSRPSKRLTLAQLDKSKQLPDLVTCLNACQIILIEMAKEAAALAGLSVTRMKSQTDDVIRDDPYGMGKLAMVNIVGEIWFSYLRAWKDAASNYSKLYPELRFSMRDSFIQIVVRSMLMRNLSAKTIHDMETKEDFLKSAPRKKISPSDGVSKNDGSINVKGSIKKKVRFSDTKDENVAAKKRCFLNNKVVDEYRFPDKSISVNEREKTDSSEKRKVSIKYYRRHVRSIPIMLNQIPLKDGAVDSDYAVMSLNLSMKLLVSIVFLALKHLRAGVASFQIATWIASGVMSFGPKCFQSLPSDVQEKLYLVRGFFNQKELPSATTLEHDTDLLIIAVRGYFDVMRFTRKKFTELQRRNFNSYTSAKVRQLLTSMKLNDDAYNQVKQIGYVDNIPFMTLRFIAELGLSQQALDYSFAIMGLFRPDSRKRNPIKWLPPSLVSAAPDKLVSPIHILAVIVVACKMCPGWENWSILRKTHERENQLNSNYSDDRESGFTPTTCANDDPVSSSSSTPHLTAELARSLRVPLVPSCNAQLEFVGNGQCIEDYLNYIDNTVAPFFPQMELHEKLLDSWQYMFPRRRTVQTDKMVRPNDTMAGGLNPNLPEKVTPNVKNHEWLLRFREKGAVWADVNGLGSYIIYDDFKRHSRSKQFSLVHVHRSLSNMSPMPFHSHYGLLIEFVSYTFNVEPSELHYLVACMDEELSKLTRPQAEMKPRTFRLQNSHYD